MNVEYTNSMRIVAQGFHARRDSLAAQPTGEVFHTGQRCHLWFMFSKKPAEVVIENFRENKFWGPDIFFWLKMGDGTWELRHLEWDPRMTPMKAIQ